MNYKKRKLILENIAPFMGDSLIKVLVGQRRVGKSYILYQLMDELKQKNSAINCLYVNKEDLAFDDIKNYTQLVSYIESNTLIDQPTAVFIDEIQEIYQFEKALRHLQLSGNYDIYCTGSNANLLSGELATLLAGRYILITIHALSYSEYLEFYNRIDSPESFMAYIKYGGMPHLINLKNDEAVYYEYLRNLFSTIVLKDIIARYNIRNISFLNDLIKFLANNLGSIVSANRISDFLKSQQLSIQPRSVQEYLCYLESVMFIDRVKRTEIEGRKIFEIGDKFYFEDIGMRHSIIPFNIKDMGKILENVVYHWLKVNGYNVFVGKMQQKEINFVAEKDNQLIYIQVAYLIVDESTHLREFGNLMEIKDNYRKIVISMDEFASSNYLGVEHWNIRKFLINFI